jgi:histidine triad (HIT) family protein
MSEADCYICFRHQQRDQITGGVLFEDDAVLVGMVKPGADGRTYLGYVVVEPKRHVPDLSELTVKEGQAIGHQVARFSRAIRELTRVVHIYAFVLGDHVRHVHVHVVGRYAHTPREWWGIKVDEWPDAPRGTPEEITALAEHMRVWLATHPEE